MARTDRLHRSELAVPGTNERAIEKAPTLGADVVFLDLEDAVAPDDKERARANVVEALGALDWRRCAVSVRINGAETAVMKDCEVPTGYLGMQAEFFFIEFRNLKFRPK